MREWSKPVSTLLLGFGLLTFCVYVYLSHTPLNYTYDGMVFAARVERDNVPLWDMFHPHHLIYTYLGRLFFLWGRDHGASWDGLVALQCFDMMTGCLGVLIAFHLLVRITNDRLISVLSALGLGFSFSYWYFSTSPGVRMFATVTPLFAWYVLTYIKKSRPAIGIWLGLAHALAVLGHQTNVMLIPAFLGGIWLIEEKSFWDKIKTSLYYLCSLTVAVLGVYGYVGRYAWHTLTYASWMWWIFSYFHVQQWGGHMEAAGINGSGFAMVKAFLQKNLLTDTMEGNFTFQTAQTLLLYALWFLLAVLLLRLKSLWKNQKQTLWVGFLWLLAFVPFFIWWEPWNIEFWVSSTVPCWILMGVVVSNLSNAFSQPVLHFSNRILVMVFWAGVITLMFFYNFSSVVQTMASPISSTVTPKEPVYAHQDLLEALDIKVRPKDLLILDGINTIPMYIDRYKKMNYLSLHVFLKKYLQNEKNTEKALATQTPIPADPWGDLTNLMKDKWKHHHRVWVLAEVVDEKDQWRMKLENLMGLPLGQLTEFFNEFELKPVLYHKNIYFYQVLEPMTPSPETTNAETKS
jgi:hypothetical protein